ncbi:hypothetical protein [Mycobacterium deserti]|uniref:DUF3592 domain-containing protein n=1 Tax=Mycobacterium deserti TaxID=2978347 RepID=A0ABT2MJA6_9MYCO|nr:hypothetical protein [Mycobacterium deserti]MCT7661066.1 hypothetical protein [Mycobacterium deserti]
MFELLVLVVLIGALFLLAAPWIRRRRGMGGMGSDWVPGTMLVTGVSPRGEDAAEQFVTITGVINGPTVNEHVVYQRMVVNPDNWPTMGQLIDVVYSPKNPDNWNFAPPDAPLPPPPGPPPPNQPPHVH